MIRRDQVQASSAGPIGPTRNPTTSFLTATTLIYAIGAGITAAAGTRLALQLVLDRVFTSFSFQLPDLERPGIVIYRHYLPVSGLGNLAPAAFLGCGSRLSGSLSGIKP